MFHFNRVMLECINIFDVCVVGCSDLDWDPRLSCSLSFRLIWSHLSYSFQAVLGDGLWVAEDILVLSVTDELLTCCCFPFNIKYVLLMCFFCNEWMQALLLLYRAVSVWKVQGLSIQGKKAHNVHGHPKLRWEHCACSHIFSVVVLRKWAHPFVKLKLLMLRVHQLKLSCDKHVDYAYFLCVCRGIFSLTTFWNAYRAGPPFQVRTSISASAQLQYKVQHIVQYCQQIKTNLCKHKVCSSTLLIYRIRRNSSQLQWWLLYDNVFALSAFHLLKEL